MSQARNRLLGILTALVVSVGIGVLLVSAEGASYFYLKATGRTARPLFFAADRELPAENVEIDHLDPHLGYAHDASRLDLPGFARYGDEDASFRVATLGGSTTDPLLAEAPWSLQLQRKAAEISPLVVYNGGVGGYSSSQETFKLIRDVLPLNPHVVISLNGINDLGFCHAVEPAYPMVNSYQSYVLNTLTRSKDPSWRGYVDAAVAPNFVYIVRAAVRKLTSNGEPDSRKRRVNFGTRYDAEPFEVWARNVRLMHSVSGEFGIDYLVFLQPTLGIGTYAPDAHEQAMLEESSATWEPRDYGAFVRDFYAGARRTCRELDYCVDLTNVFDGQAGGLYADYRHPNNRGYGLIAEAVQREMEARRLLDGDSL